jgi:hypothetical protein
MLGLGELDVQTCGSQRISGTTCTAQGFKPGSWSEVKRGFMSANVVISGYATCSDQVGGLMAEHKQH